MRRINTKWKIVIASICVGSAALLAGCTSQSTGNESTTPETENNTGEPADVKIDTPGLDVEINSERDSAKVDIDVPEDQGSQHVDIDVSSPE